MPSRARGKQAVYNTPTIRNGGFGYLQVEAIHNRPMSIARRHLAASELRMRGIEPNELSSSEWVRFLVMEPAERERWITVFEKRRRNSNESTDSNESVDAEGESAAAVAKAEEARLEAEEAARVERSEFAAVQAVQTSAAAAELAMAASAVASPPNAGRTPSVSIWARQFDRQNDDEGGEYSARRPRHARRAVTDGIIEAPPPPPTYETAVRARTPPPAYEPRSDDDEPTSPRQVRFAM